MILNGKLVEIVPFQDENNQWFLKLVYEYEDERGKFKRIFPKVLVPFPAFPTPLYRDICTGDISLEPYICCFERVPLYQATCDLAMERGITTEDVVFDISIEEATREMTMSEIEKQLGYKIKLVNKESKS